MAILNLLLDNEAIEFLTKLEEKAKTENFKVKGYIAGPDWEWSNKCSANIDSAVILIVNEGIAEAIIRNYENNEYSISHIQIDVYSGKSHTTRFCFERDFYKASTRFGSEVYQMIESYSNELKFS